ncbi:MAG: glycoside hydrolase family 127 protein, partial [Spirochaetaceae bacterium]|nr:glycoside hydrolase family 127 protein [Spirochaetaceae bacterium]
AVGHAVRAVYMYSGMADVAALTEDWEYVDAITRIWDDVVGSKLYITGGVGARHEGEAFGDRFELPNQSAYAETCAAIAMLFWSHRMFLLTGAGSYMDVFERTLYNGFLAGVGLSGDRFFYSNPLESDGQWPFNQGHTDRQPWFECSCCPTNVVRFMPSLSGYVYAVRGDAVFVNLYMASEATIPVAGIQVGLRQETDYPWDGSVRITVTPTSPASFDLHFRIPGWARNEPAPGNLYRYADDEHPSVSLRVNGGAVEARTDNGYLVVRRSWQTGDVVELSFDMPIRRVATDSRVEANRGKLALERGPVVYCFEEIDNTPSLESASLSSPLVFRSEMREDLLGGVVTLTDGSLTAVPYFAWANRGSGQMRVWVPDS